MKTKIMRLLNSEIVSSVMYVICKILFSLVLAGTGIFYLSSYISEKKYTSVLDMFTGVIVLVLGGFLFMNPQLVVKLLPLFLGAMILIDSIWIFRAGLRLRKRGIELWQGFGVAALLDVIFGIVLMINPFGTVRKTVIFAGIIYLLNGASDIVLYVLRRKKLGNPNPAEESAEDSMEGQETEEYPSYDAWHQDNGEGAEPARETAEPDSLEKKPDSHYIETADDFIVTRPELHLEEGDAGSNEVIIEEKGPLEEWQD